MCVYCNCGDMFFKHRPPWNPHDYPPWPPQVPRPITPYMPLPLPVDHLKEFKKLLVDVKAMEDKLGCPCEPNKADYLDLLKKRIDYLEKE